jgi:D-alanyl-D-alanine carboxypeptidase
VVSGPDSVADAFASQVRPSADRTQQRLDGLVRDDRFPAALAAVRDRSGRIRNYTAGVGDLKTRSKVPVDGQVRIGSNTMSAAEGGGLRGSRGDGRLVRMGDRRA